MNRRQFLASSSLLAVGCSRAVPPSTQRAEPLPRSEQFRVAPAASRTTPRAPFDVLEQFPELKPLVRVAVRLHPRFGEEPAASSSKLGGQFLWPANEEWPTCPEFREPMVPILQLSTADASPQFPFRPKTDLFQLFWSPRRTKSGSPHVVGIWRNSSDVGKRLLPPPNGSPDWQPLPCRLFPERLSELPHPSSMPTIMREKIDRAPFAAEFATNLSAARGTKVGGWPRAASLTAMCHTCKHPMDYLLTVDSCEWTKDSLRWKPNEDADEDGFRRAAGFDFGSAVQVYHCRRCEKWPLRGLLANPL